MLGTGGAGGVRTGVVSTPSGDEMGSWLTAGTVGSFENALM
jgi:hypothetical protein